MNENKYQLFNDVLKQTALEAGAKIMEIHAQGFDVNYKDDKSPVTIADDAAEKIILRDLKKIAPEIPIVAEESASIGDIPEVDNIFWLVDPLDGTKEFIAKRKEFTVNIALIENGRPTFGIVYAPALDTLYIAKNSDMAVMQEVSNLKTLGEEQILKVRDVPASGISAVASKSHRDAETNALLDKYNVTDILSIGSSLKFCLLAEGKADFYPRFGPTMEWDTAAGHAVLNAAGGSIIHPDGSEYLYSKPDFRNGPFIATGKMIL
ncbi:MAG: 3'(2'),5'-bisphosphate nucleotidase CysQ [Kordiimonadaceae bacterium]|nr:3'(2'),5'-bisphosphate nucleotidase CysQ [Kordiimonadaceae bacterium]MBT6328313.1 3'(2'),5'-bisphosphate nucleotidase CysQ [Kordiimonadaceae bacterium]